MFPFCNLPWRHVFPFGPVGKDLERQHFWRFRYSASLLVTSSAFSEVSIILPFSPLNVADPTYLQSSSSIFSRNIVSSTPPPPPAQVLFRRCFFGPLANLVRCAGRGSPNSQIPPCPHSPFFSMSLQFLCTVQNSFFCSIPPHPFTVCSFRACLSGPLLPSPVVPVRFNFSVSGFDFP